MKGAPRPEPTADIESARNISELVKNKPVYLGGRRAGSCPFIMRPLENSPNYSGSRKRGLGSFIREVSESSEGEPPFSLPLSPLSGRDAWRYAEPAGGRAR